MDKLQGPIRYVISEIAHPYGREREKAEERFAGWVAWEWGAALKVSKEQEKGCSSPPRERDPASFIQEDCL